MPERYSYGEDSRDFWPTWNSDPLKMDNLRTEACWDPKSRGVRAQAPEMQPPLQEERKAGPGKRIKKGQALLLPIHNQSQQPFQQLKTSQAQVSRTQAASSWLHSQGDQ